MRFVIALALCWITQLQAAPPLQKEAGQQTARDPFGHVLQPNASQPWDTALQQLTAWVDPHTNRKGDQAREGAPEVSRVFKRLPLLSEHTAPFQLAMALARSEANNRALLQENQQKQQLLLHQQSASNCQLSLLGLLVLALLLLGYTSHRLYRSTRHLYQLANFDQLTELPNRRALLERLLTEWLADSRPISLLIIDIDLFKQINDCHGHRAGDLAIQQLARELQAWAPTQPLVGRWGGEEFLVGIPLTGEDSWHLAEQLRIRIARLDSLPMTMTISIGVAERCTTDGCLAELIHRADMAMYQAKRLGRNQTILAAMPLVHEV